jgi:hypothetical protein
VTPDVIRAWEGLEPELRDVSQSHLSEGESRRRLLDFGDERIAAMDAAGIDISLLSLTAPGLQSIDANDAVALHTGVYLAV